MDKLPLIKPQKRPTPLSSFSNYSPNYCHQPPKLLYSQINDNENELSKNQNFKSYDLAIDYYTKNINMNKNNTIFLIKRAICYLARGHFPLALKDALKSIEIDKTFKKGYYIASLSYLEMYDIENSEKYSSKKNLRLKCLIEKRKNDILYKSKKFSNYPLYIKFLKE